jgi:UDP-glucose 4-epimerase
MRWLITGGCGFIGRNLIRLLLAEPGHEIRILDDLSVGTCADLAAAAGNAAERIELLIGDIRDEELMQRAASGREVMVHLAANTGVDPSIEDPKRDCLLNVVGTLNALEACRVAGVKRFVFASSGAPVGECEPPLHEELPGHPISPYGASKLAGEAYCSAYQCSFGIDAVALRFGNCYGPFSGHKGSIVARFIRQAMAGESWQIYGDGKQTRDFVYVDDVTDAILRAARVAGIGGHVFQIATSAETTVAELAERLAVALQRHGIAAPEPRHATARTGDVKRNFSNVTKARRQLGWSPRVSLEEGLDRTVRWFLAQGRRR